MLVEFVKPQAFRWHNLPNIETQELKRLQLEGIFI